MSNILGLSEHTFREILKMIANTEPHLEIVEEIINYLDRGYPLTPQVNAILERDKERIMQIAKIIETENGGSDY